MELAEEKKRLRHAQGKALAKLVNRQAYAAFAAWHETKVEAQRNRYVAFKAASFLLNRCTGSALRMWREWAAEHKRQIVGVTRCLAKRKSARPLLIFASASDPCGALYSDQRCAGFRIFGVGREGARDAAKSADARKGDHPPSQRQSCTRLRHVELDLRHHSGGPGNSAPDYKQPVARGLCPLGGLC